MRRLQSHELPAPFDPGHTLAWFEDHPDEAESFQSDGRSGWRAVAYYCTAGMSAFSDPLRDRFEYERNVLLAQVKEFRQKCDPNENVVLVNHVELALS